MEGVILNSDACDPAGTAAMTKATMIIMMKVVARCNVDHDNASEIIKLANEVMMSDRISLPF